MNENFISDKAVREIAKMQRDVQALSTKVNRLGNAGPRQDGTIYAKITGNTAEKYTGEQVMFDGTAWQTVTGGITWGVAAADIQLREINGSETVAADSVFEVRRMSDGVSVWWGFAEAGGCTASIFNEPYVDTDTSELVFSWNAFSARSVSPNGQYMYINKKAGEVRFTSLSMTGIVFKMVRAGHSSDGNTMMWYSPSTTTTDSDTEETEDELQLTGQQIGEWSKSGSDWGFSSIYPNDVYPTFNLDWLYTPNPSFLKGALYLPPGIGYIDCPAQNLVIDASTDEDIICGWKDTITPLSEVAFYDLASNSGGYTKYEIIGHIKTDAVTNLKGLTFVSHAWQYPTTVGYSGTMTGHDGDGTVTMRDGKVMKKSGGNVSVTNHYDFETQVQGIIDADPAVSGSVTAHDDVFSAGSGYIITDAERTKLNGIEAGAEVNNISDANAALLTGGGEITLHSHPSSGDVVGPASSVDENIAVFDGITGKLIKDGGNSISFVLDRTNHTGSQLASTISDFDSAVSSNSAVSANTAKVSATGSVTTHSDVTGAGSGIIISSAERTKLNGIETGAQVNNISDANATDLTDGGQTSLHTHAATAPTAHAITHTNGSDDIQDATASQKGLMTIAYAGKLDGIEAGAEVNNMSDANATELTDGSTTTLHYHADAGGDVVGPASATDNAFPRYDTTTGKLLQNGQTTEDDSGNVSIAGQLTVPKVTSGNVLGNDKFLVYENGNAKYGIGVASGELRLFGADPSSNITLGNVKTSDGTTFEEFVRLDNNTGAFCIGATTPIGSEKLRVNGTALVDGTIYSNTNGETTTGGNIRIGKTDADTQKYNAITSTQYASGTETEGFTLIAGVGISAGVSEVRLGGGIGQQNTSSVIALYTGDPATRTGTERMRVDSSGQVLIGTTTAISTEKLGVSGDFYFNTTAQVMKSDGNGIKIGSVAYGSGSLNVAGRVDVEGGAVAVDAIYRLKRSTNTEWLDIAAWRGGSLGNNAYSFDLVGTNARDLFFRRSTDGSSYTTHMTFKSSGQFLIGATSAIGSEKLRVNGSAHFDAELTLAEISTPTATTNYGKVYTKTDNKLYFQDGAGTEHEIAFV